MTVKELKLDLENMPDDFEVVLSQVLIISAKEGLSAILDIPFIGIVKNDDHKEVKFCVDSSKELRKLYGDFIKRI